MSTMDKDTTNNKWKLSYSMPGAGTKTITFPTKDKYVDENIEVKVTNAEGALGVTSSSVEGISNVGILGSGQASQPASGGYVKVSGGAVVGVTTAGWLDTTASQSVTAADVYYPIVNATFERDGAAFKSVTEGYVAASQTLITMPGASQTITGGGLSTTSSSTALASNGLSNGTTEDATKKIALSDTKAANTYELETSGSFTTARAAVTKQVTSEGYVAEDSSAVEAIAAGSHTDNNAHAKYYVAQSTLSTDTVQSSSVDQTVTVGPGYYHETRTITVQAMGAATVAPNVANTGLSTYFDAGTSSANDVSLTPRYSVTAAGYVALQTNTAGDPEYYSIKTTSVTQGDSSIANETLTRGSATWGTGWIETGSIAPATFSNTVPSGMQSSEFLDISDYAPALISGSGLFIKKGYVDNLYISLAQFAPDTPSADLASNKMLNGYSALDRDGNLVTGNIQTYDGSYTIE